jgi:hypothetical protein
VGGECDRRGDALTGFTGSRKPEHLLERQETAQVGDLFRSGNTFVDGCAVEARGDGLKL